MALNCPRTSRKHRQYHKEEKGEHLVELFLKIHIVTIQGIRFIPEFVRACPPTGAMVRSTFLVSINNAKSNIFAKKGTLSDKQGVTAGDVQHGSEKDLKIWRQKCIRKDAPHHK